MYAAVDWSITPRPLYPADGRKVFDIYTWPYSVRTEIKRDLGEFPFPCFWGPAAGQDTPQGSAEAVSQWIAQAAQWIERKFAPTLSLVYLPHLDYNLQRLGPGHALIGRDVSRIDRVVGELIDFFGQRSVQVVVLSEYGIGAVSRPIHLNRLFRRQGWLALKEELGRDLLDAGASKVFAVADHQVAHVYCRDASLLGQVRQFLESQPGISEVLDSPAKRQRGLDHPRAGDLVAVADAQSWFARTVDIHRKPGYDPVELFLDPSIPGIKARIAWRLLQKRLGLRMLMDVIPLDAGLVRGSHGRVPNDRKEWPVLLSSRPDLLPQPSIEAAGVCRILLAHLLDAG
jgi:predicted AlkP superfamily pyrophosphatase or phosphodiesterase